MKVTRLNLDSIAMLACALVAGATTSSGCSHTQTVGPAEPPGEESAGPSSHESAAAPARRTSGLKGRQGQPEDVSIASSPGLLLKPGAAKAIQEKLIQAGVMHGEARDELDTPARDALAQFQRGHDLPATGFPDDATMKKLGLKPEHVFRSGTGD